MKNVVTMYNPGWMNRDYTANCPECRVQCSYASLGFHEEKRADDAVKALNAMLDKAGCTHWKEFHDEGSVHDPRTEVRRSFSIDGELTGELVLYDQLLQGEGRIGEAFWYFRSRFASTLGISERSDRDAVDWACWRPWVLSLDPPSGRGYFASAGRETDMLTVADAARFIEKCYRAWVSEGRPLRYAKDVPQEPRAVSE